MTKETLKAELIFILNAWGVPIPANATFDQLMDLYAMGSPKEKSRRRR